jgi:hypothetical protein
MQKVTDTKYYKSKNKNHKKNFRNKSLFNAFYPIIKLTPTIIKIIHYIINYISYIIYVIIYTTYSIAFIIFECLDVWMFGFLDVLI